jgi:hypothetical protein
MIHRATAGSRKIGRNKQESRNWMSPNANSGRIHLPSQSFLSLRTSQLLKQVSPTRELLMTCLGKIGPCSNVTREISSKKDRLFETESARRPWLGTTKTSSPPPPNRSIRTSTWTKLEVESVPHSTPEMQKGIKHACSHGEGRVCGVVWIAN